MSKSKPKGYLATPAPEIRRRLQELCRTYEQDPEALLTLLINSEYARLERVKLVPKSPRKPIPRRLRHKFWLR